MDMCFKVGIVSHLVCDAHFYEQIALANGWRRPVKKRYPTVTNTDISMILSLEWSDAPAELREKYNNAYHMEMEQCRRQQASMHMQLAESQSGIMSNMMQRTVLLQGSMTQCHCSAMQHHYTEMLSTMRHRASLSNKTFSEQNHIFAAIFGPRPPSTQQPKPAERLRQASSLIRLAGIQNSWIGNENGATQHLSTTISSMMQHRANLAHKTLSEQNHVLAAMLGVTPPPPFTPSPPPPR
jgi:hypothetical protein